jgi:hypothetical protein
MTQPYQAGKTAYNAGLGLSANPHSWNNRSQPEHDHTSWNDGWIGACLHDRPAGRLFKMLISAGVSMETCLAAEERLRSPLST